MKCVFCNENGKIIILCFRCIHINYCDLDWAIIPKDKIVFDLKSCQLCLKSNIFCATVVMCDKC